MVTGSEGNFAEPLWVELGQARLLAGRPLHFLPIVDSTNRLALELAGQGIERAVVVAESQSHGRGRLARSWHSPPGAGIYLSLLYRPRLDPADLAKLTLAAGLAVSLAVEKSTGLTPSLKWPNDLLLDGKKCGGILCECRLAAGLAAPTKGGVEAGHGGLGRADQGEPEIAGHAERKVNPNKGIPVAAGGTAVVVGIGLNVNPGSGQIPPEIEERATSLYLASGHSWDRGALLVALVTQMDALVGTLEQGGFAEILAAWRQRDALLGRELSWLTPAGTIVRGLALGPDDDGQLRIRDGQGRIHEVISGDISVDLHKDVY